MTTHKMNKQVQVRMPLPMWEHLVDLANKRAPGTKPSLLIREAIQKTYFPEDPNGGHGQPPIAPPPPTPCPITEITALRAAEGAKRSKSL